MSRSSSSRRAGRSGGFTLLEVLVAFALLAVMLVALLQAFTQGLGVQHAAEERSTAVLVARSKLAEVDRVLPLEEGEESGELEDGLAWRLVVTPHEDPDGEGSDDELLRLYQVTVTVERDGRPLAEITSLRLGAEP